MQRTYLVTQKHIDKAKVYGNSDTNPIALAIRSVIRRPTFVDFVGTGNYNTSQGKYRTFTVDEKAVEFLSRFYEGKKVKPIKVTITMDFPQGSGWVKR